MRQLPVAITAFAVVFLPASPGLLYMLHTRSSHVFDDPPRWIDLAWTVAPGWFLLIVGGGALTALLVAAWTSPPWDPQSYFQIWRAALCLALGVVPILILYAVSVGTPLHIFIHRYRMVALPGIAITWALLIGGFKPRVIWVLLCLALVTVAARHYFSSPLARHHGYTWKYALEVAENNASADNSPVLICSDPPESDHLPMPMDSPKDSTLFAQLSYYNLSGPVVPMPRSLNAEALRVGEHFLEDVEARHQRFLALASVPSYKTLDWVAEQLSVTYDRRELGTFDYVKVVEFTPRKPQ